MDVTQPINSDQDSLNAWKSVLGAKHKRAIENLRAMFQKDPAFKVELVQYFPGFTWPEFADTPESNTLSNIASTVASLMENRKVHMSDQTFAALHDYLNTYDRMIGAVPPQEQKGRVSKKKPQPSPKIKQLQQLLGVEQSGVWSPQDNAAFLSWLKANGWEKYISGNKFTGKIDDAIRAMLIEKTPSAQPTKPEDDIIEHGPPPLPAAKSSRSERLERLKKLS